MIEICKRVEFAAAHRLNGHESRCMFLHGHNYKVDIFITGNTLDSVGRLVDFKEVKNGLGKWIDDNWDHSFIYNSLDKISCDIVSVLLKHNKAERIYCFPCANPTAENMCVKLDEIVKMNSDKWNSVNYHISKIRVWETDTAYAEVEVVY